MTSSDQPLVSVVTPVYNGARYIEECISSVIRQTYENWEYTIVDNASTDGTEEVAAALVASDPRIRYVRFDEFVDANTNHNRAFDAVSPESEFCKVVQADDWIYPECLERMVAAGLVSENIGIVGSYRLWQSQVDLVGVPYTETLVEGRRILRQCLLGGPYVTGAPTALLLRSRFVRERRPFFQPGFWHDDTEAAYWLLSRHDFGYVHQVLTFARRQAGARMETASRVGTYDAENIRFTLRYGREALTEEEYRGCLRHCLWLYLRSQLRQLPKPSRLRERDFYEIHRAEVASILEEGGDDRLVRTTMAVIDGLLRRGVLAR